MKKSFYILAGAIVFASALNSCNKANPAGQAAKDQLQVDSMVNMKLSTLRTSLLADFNKTTLMMAATKADSIENAKPADKKAAPKKKEKEVAKKPSNATDDKMNGKGNQTSAQKTDNKMNGNAQQNSGQKTDDKMNRLKNQQQPPK